MRQIDWSNRKTQAKLSFLVCVVFLAAGSVAYNVLGDHYEVETVQRETKHEADYSHLETLIYMGLFAIAIGFGILAFVRYGQHMNNEPTMIRLGENLVLPNGHGVDPLRFHFELQCETANMPPVLKIVFDDENGVPVVYETPELPRDQPVT